MTEGAEPYAPGDPWIGRVLDARYKILRKLGEGGMGAVYEGEHVGIGRRVAIKVLHPSMTAHEELVARFQQEARAASAIGHEHIVEVTDMGSAAPDGALYMVLELLSGRDLAHLINDEPLLPIGRVIRIVQQICEALGAAHAKGIVHRDLKPENVFLVRRSGDPDFVKVLDFGISKVFESDSMRPSGMTRTGALMGTPHFMPPEQARGEKALDHRADIYAIGVILFRALAKGFPFDDESFPGLLMKICHGTPTPLRAFRGDVPIALEGVVHACLAKLPADRYQTCAELSAALEPFAGIMHTPIPSSRPPAQPAMATAMLPTSPEPAPAFGTETPPAQAVQPEPAPSRRWIALVALAGAGLAVGAGAFWIGAGSLFTPAPPPPPPPPPPPGDVTNDVVRPPPDPPADPPDPPRQDPQPPDPPAAPRVHITIDTEPASAQLFLDGRPIANPFDAELPSSLELHSLEARAPGYTTSMQDLSLEYPQRVRVRLHRGQGIADDRGRPNPPPPPEHVTHDPPPGHVQVVDRPPEVVIPPPNQGLKRIVIP